MRKKRRSERQRKKGKRKLSSPTESSCRTVFKRSAGRQKSSGKGLRCSAAFRGSVSRRGAGRTNAATTGNDERSEQVPTRGSLCIVESRFNESKRRLERTERERDVHRGVDKESPENRAGTKKNRGEEFNEWVAARNNNVTRFIYKKKKRKKKKKENGEKGKKQRKKRRDDDEKRVGGGESRGKNRRAEARRVVALRIFVSGEMRPR